MVIVILPDGSRREVADGATAYDVAEGISPGLARAAIVAEVDGELRDLHAPLVGRRRERRRKPSGARSSAQASHQERRRSARRHAAQRRPRHGAGRHAAVRTQSQRRPGVRPDHRDRLLLRHRLDRAALRGGLPGDRGRDGEDRRRGRAVRADRASPRDEAGELCARPGAGAQGRAHRHGPGRPADRCRSTARASSSTCAAARTFPAPGTSAAFKLLCVAGAYWKGDAVARAAPAALRHRVLRQEGARRAPARRSKRRRAATTACSASSSSCSPSARPSARA